MELFKNKPSHFGMEIHPKTNSGGLSPKKKNKVAKSDVAHLTTLKPIYNERRGCYELNFFG
jgi:hypothetical protein